MKRRLALNIEQDTAEAKCEAYTRRLNGCHRLTTLRIEGHALCAQHAGQFLQYGNLQLQGVEIYMEHPKNEDA